MKSIDGVQFQLNDGTWFQVRLNSIGERQVLVLCDSHGQRFEIGHDVNAFKNLAAAIDFIADRQGVKV